MKFFWLTMILFYTLQTFSAPCIRVKSLELKSCTDQKYRVVGSLKAKTGFIENVSFNEANFQNSTFENVVFRNIDFRGALFKKVIFKRCRFEGSNFSGTRWTNSQVIDSVFVDSLFVHAFFSSTKMTLAPESMKAFTNCFAIGSYLGPSSLCANGLY